MGQPGDHGLHPLDADILSLSDLSDSADEALPTFGDAATRDRADMNDRLARNADRLEELLDDFARDVGMDANDFEHASEHDSFTSIEVRPALKQSKLVCPDCRHAIDRAPFPVFVIKDLADQIRVQEQPAGLLWDGTRAASESSAPIKAEPKPLFEAGSSPRPAKPEAPKKPVWDPKDPTWAGLFPDRTKDDAYQRATRRGLDDASDGVARCLYCNWEIEDGECGHWCAGRPSCA
jgi:hypothetical protein